MILRLVPSIIIISIFTIIINITKLESSIASAAIHITMQLFFIVACLSLISNKVVRLLLLLFLSTELFTQLAYDSSLSIGMIMSIVSASFYETGAFITFNILNVIATTIFIVYLYFFPPKLPSSFSKSIFGLGLLYIFLPTAITLSSQKESHKYLNYIKTGIAKGFSTTYTSIEFFIQEDIAWRLPAVKPIRGLTDTIMFLSKQRETESTWKNVTYDKDGPELLILGIGESLRADNLSLYGYERETTPFLDSLAKQLTVVEDTYSAGTNTWSSLPATLTMNTIGPDFSKSIINLAKDAGYQTYWISNHARTSNWDFSVSAIAEQADYKYFFSEDKAGSVYDIELVRKVEPLLQVGMNKKLIILHFYGSHMAFSDRYPPEFSFFNKKSDIDNYDNSVRYMDSVQKQLITIVKKYRGKYLFFADHGLGNPQGPIPLKHDVRENPNIDSLRVPLFIFPKEQTSPVSKKTKHTSLFYFECIFSRWAGISSSQLEKNDYCKTSMENENIKFVDSTLRVNITNSP